MRKGTRSNRDDFSKLVKLELAKGVNFRCSICNAQKVGPQANSNKSFSIGKAAHTKTVTPGGQRNDLAQHPEERRSINNGIWGCATCADVIDRDVAAYSVAEPHRLKDQAERLAHERVGRVANAPTAIVPTPSATQRAVQFFCLSEAKRQEQLAPRSGV